MNSSSILRMVRTGTLAVGLLGCGQSLRAADLIWQGDVSPDWDIGTTANWTDGTTGVPAVFSNSDHVTFDDTAITSAVVLTDVVAPGSVTVDNTVLTYSFGGTGGITGTGSLTKNGIGTLTVLTANTYTGDTTINAGTLSLATAYLNDTSTLTIASGAVLNLTHGDIDQVGTLVIGGVSQPNGLYDSANTGGAITGTGKIQVGTCCPAGATPGPELVVNPDFSAGNTGFTSDYGLLSPTCSPGLYTVANSLTVVGMCNNWTGLDHTTGAAAGMFFVADGSMTLGQAAWRQQVSLSPSTRYSFCAWVNNLNEPGFDRADPIVEAWLVPSSGPAVLLATTGALPESPDTWVQISAAWSSPAVVSNPYHLEFRTAGTSFEGNNFALDDISFRVCNPPCVDCPPLNQTVTGCPPVVPDYTHLNYCAPPDGPLTVTQNPPAGTVLPPGQTVVVIHICNAAGQCRDCDVIITAVYLPGCYACCPAGATPGPELVVNPDFSAGNTGFTSDYGLLSPTCSPGLYTVANSLTVVGMCNNWTGLDHTTGAAAGMFFVADGSMTLGQAAWRQQVSLSPSTRYSFCAWVNNLNEPGFDRADPIVEAWLVPSSGPAVLLATTGALPESPDTWVQISAAWSSPAVVSNPYHLEFRTAGTSFEGNNFALDDISFRVCNPPYVDCPPPTACADPTVTVYSAGTTTDDFAGPEPAQPSGALVQRLVAAGVTSFKDFDDCGFNSYFAHTFANLPSCIVDARLRIRLKACGDLCDNDAFHLQFTAPSGASDAVRWGRYLGNGNPGGGIGLFNTIWSAGTVREITLDLADLTNADGSKTNLLSKLNQYGFLDLLMQDDTAIDFAELQITSCCCRSDLVVVTPANACCAVVNYTPPVFTSQCGPVTVVCTPPPGTCFPIGTTVVTCVGTDTLGQQGRCVFKITVVDTIPPVITSCPETVIACMGSDIASGVLPDLTTQVVATDNCTPYPQLTITQNPPPGTIVSGGTVTFTVTDASGNTATCSRPVSVQPCCVKPPGGMVLWLPFDEIAGPFATNAVGGNNGNLVNGLTHPGPGYVGNGLCFDGVDDFVQVASYPAIGFGTGDFTVDAWVKPAAVEDTIRVIVDHRESSANGIIGYSLFLGGGNTIGFQIADGPHINYPSTLSVPADGQWHLVAVTVRRNDPQGITFYLDGVPLLPGRDTIPFPGSVTPAAGFPLRVGARSFSPDGIFNGCIDEVELFNRQLSATEIKALYNARSMGKCKHRCTVPWDTPICAGASSTVTTATIYNPNPTVQTYQYSFQGLPVGPHCSYPGPTSFSPAAGTINVPAGGSISFPVTVGKPAGMPCGAIACFQMVINPVGTGERFTCEGSLYNSCHLCASPNPAIANLDGLAAADVAWTLVNTSAADIDLTGARFTAWGPDMRPDTRVLSLNGLPPGSPALVAPGTILPVGGQLQLPLSVRFTTFDPGQAFSLLLEADLDGDGEFEPLSSMEVANVIPPTLSPYAAWAALYAGGETAPADGDYNNDGVDNGIAFFMGMNGLATHPGVVGNSVTWPYVNAVTSYQVQTSADLGLSGWTEVLPSDPRLHVTAPGPSGSVSYDLLPSAAGQNYVRLRVTP